MRQSAVGYDIRQVTQEVQAQLQTVTQQSELGEWTHSEFTPRHLAHVVEKMWHFDGRMALLRERGRLNFFPRLRRCLAPS